MMRSLKKQCFTLMEMLVVLFIISLGIIVTGVKINGVYQEQRFLSESQQILSHLSMAQDLMLILDTDVNIFFSQKKGGAPLHVWLDIEKPLEERWARLLERKLSLTAIQAVTLNGHSAHTLEFSLGKMSQGELVLTGSDKKIFEIFLPGYPSPLGNSKKEPALHRSELLYPTEVYKKLYEEPHEKS